MNCLARTGRDTGCAGRRAYARRRAREIAYGRWAPWAEADPVLRHVQALRRAGASQHAIARAAGVSASTVCRLDRAGRGHSPIRHRRVRAVPAQRLLAVSVSALLESAARVQAAGTRRRLQALVAVGYPRAALARMAGVTPQTCSRIIGERTASVTNATHAAVRDLYDRIWDVPPPEHTVAQRRAADAARNTAARLGWPAPMGLDDDRIDDPNYRPRTHWRPVGIKPGNFEDLPLDGPGRRMVTGQGPGYRGHGPRPGKGQRYAAAR